MIPAPTWRIIEEFTNLLCETRVVPADPGFPVGGGVHPLGGHEPLTWVLFGENVCKNERIGSHRWHAPGTPAPPPQIRQWVPNYYST